MWHVALLIGCVNYILESVDRMSGIMEGCVDITLCGQSMLFKTNPKALVESVDRMSGIMEQVVFWVVT